MKRKTKQNVKFLSLEKSEVVLNYKGNDMLIDFTLSNIC